MLSKEYEKKKFEEILKTLNDKELMDLLKLMSNKIGFIEVFSKCELAESKNFYVEKHISIPRFLTKLQTMVFTYQIYLLIDMYKNENLVDFLSFEGVYSNEKSTVNLNFVLTESSIRKFLKIAVLNDITSFVIKHRY
jgi:hypothetical protein